MADLFPRGIARAAAALLLPALLNAAPPTAGDAAPAFSLPGRQGALALGDFAGQVVWLDFWASWCGPCGDAMPWLDGLQRRHAADGLQVVGVNLDRKRPAAERFLAEHPVGFPVAFDPKAGTAEAYGLEGMPTTVLVGRDGTVLWRHVGFRPEETDSLEARVVRALAAPTPAAPAPADPEDSR